MKDVRLLVPRAGPRFSQVIGQVVPVEDDEAERMAEAGHGVIVFESQQTKNKNNKGSKNK